MKDFTDEIENAVNWLGQITYSEARRICPVRTGRLKRSLTLTENKDRAGVRFSASVHTDVPYAARVELGGPKNTPRHYLGGGIEKARRLVPYVFSIAFLGEDWV